MGKTKLLEIMREGGLDEDGNGSISKEEFSKLLEFPEACHALHEVGVDTIMLVDNIDFIFGRYDEDESDELKFEEFMALLLELRGSNAATVKDIVELQKFIKAT